MRFRKRGTTLIEFLIVVVVMGILVSFAFLNLFGTRSQNELKSASQGIAAILREARSRAVVQASGAGWGVHFENSVATSPFYALFFSTTYAPTTTVGYYRLPPTVGYAASSIAPGSFKEILFSQLSGLASVSTSVTIYLLNEPASSSTINTASSGAVSY